MSTDLAFSLFIVNDVDRPCVQHLAVRKGHGFIYVDDALRSKHKTLIGDNATSLGVFGFKEVSRTGRMVTFEQVCPCAATYADGYPRQWNDVKAFSLSLDDIDWVMI